MPAYPSGVMPSERPLYDQGMREAAERSCPRCHGPMKAVFTWHPMKPYYITCNGRCAKSENAD
jgi:hypothetical protein